MRKRIVSLPAVDWKPDGLNIRVKLQAILSPLNLLESQGQRRIRLRPCLGVGGGSPNGHAVDKSRSTCRIRLCSSTVRPRSSIDSWPKVRIPSEFAGSPSCESRRPGARPSTTTDMGLASQNTIASCRLRAWLRLATQAHAANARLLGAGVLKPSRYSRRYPGAYKSCRPETSSVPCQCRCSPANASQSTC